METTRIIQISLETWGAIICLIASICLSWGTKTDDKSSRTVVHIAMDTTLLLICDVIAWIFRGDPSKLGYYMVRISNFGTFFFTYTVHWLMFHYVIQLLSEKQASVKKYYVLFVNYMTLLSIVLLAISQFTNLYYYFDESNFYHRSSFFWISQITGYIAIPVFLVIVFTHFKLFESSELFTLLSFVCLPGIALIVQAFIYGFSLLNLALCSSVIFIFVERMHARAVKLDRTIKQLRVADKAKDTFLSNMSHELRTPINGILGMNEMILSENKDEKTLEYARGIDASSRILLSLVDDVLDYSMLRSGSMRLNEEPYVLSYLLRETIELVQPQLKAKNLDFSIQISDYIPDNLIGDHHKIKRIVLQLLTNAIKYSKQGTVTLSVRYVAEDETSGKLSISIKDEGIGMKPEQQKQIFCFFERLTENETSEGTGLGLAIAKEYADMMFGSITVESEFGKGSTFCLTLPQKTQANSKLVLASNIWKPESSAETAKSATDVLHADDAHILAVDDNKTNLKVLQLLLKRFHVHPELALSGDQALKLLQNRSYDLILMDHMMPEMDGIETYKHIQEEHLADGVPVIVVTANAVDGAKQQYLNDGFSDYISKPVRPEELERILKQWLPQDKVCDI